MKNQNTIAIYKSDNFQFMTTTEQWKVVKTLIGTAYSVGGEVLNSDEQPGLYDYTNKEGCLTMKTTEHGEILMSCQPSRVNQWVNKINNYMYSK
jgi:hypothetical protein